MVYFREYVKNVEIVYILKIGYMMFEENWDEFIKILELFLDK